MAKLMKDKFKEILTAGLGLFGHWGREAEFSQPEAEQILPDPWLSPPITGERWYLKPEADDPFGRKDGDQGVKIRDFKNNWVRYSLGIGSFSDQRLPLNQFIALYQRDSLS